MKKRVLLFMGLAGVLSLQAKPQSLPVNEGNGYPYLTFEMTDGTKASVATTSLALTFSGNTLTAGSQTFILSNLSKMYFTNTDETTGIGEISIAEIDDTTEIYDLQGRKMEHAKSPIYIIKDGDNAKKIANKGF